MLCYEKELFNRMCDFDFSIMFEYEKMTKDNNCIESMKRAVGYVGEMLYGIFIHHLLTNELRSAKYVQLFFC